MKQIQSAPPSRVPPVVWLVRVCFLALAALFGWRWIIGGAAFGASQLVLVALAAMSAAAVIASWIPRKSALVVMCTLVVAVPAVVFLLMDLLVLRGSWWEWCLVFPVQIGLPAIFAFYLSRSAPVKKYYQRNQAL